MGADMCIEAIGFRADPEGGIDPAWAAAALARARRAIAAIDEAFLARINEDSGNDFASVDQYTSELLRAADDVELAVTGRHRQAAFVAAGEDAGGRGLVLLVSGGPFWGDPPTELFESMFRLQEAGVFPDARTPEPPDGGGVAPA